MDIKKKKIRISTEKTGLNKKQKRENERLSKIPDSSPVLIILYLLGLFGIMTTIGNTLEITDSVLYYVLLIGVEVFSFVLWYIYIHQNKYFLYTILGLCGLTLLFIIPSWGSIRRSFAAYSHMGVSNPDNFISVAPAVFILVTLLLFYLEFVIRHHSILFLVCMLLMIFGPVLGLSLDPVPVVLIVVFQFGFYVLNTSISGKKKLLKVKSNAHTVAMSTIVTSVILLISFIPSFIAEYLYEDEMFSQVFIADGYMQDSINELLGNFSTNVVDGSVSRGNLRQSGKPEFDVNIQHLTDKLYLKGFVGAEYDGNNWSAAYNQDGVMFEYTDTSSGTEANNLRYWMTFYREHFVTSITNTIMQQYYSDFMSKVGEFTGLNIVSLEMDMQYVYMYDSHGREIVVENGLNSDLSNGDDRLFDYFISSTPSPVVYVFKEGSTAHIYSDRMTRAIESYHSDPDSTFIERVIYLNNDDLPAYPSLLEPTRRSESISDIYSEIGAKYSEDNSDESVLLNRIQITPRSAGLRNVLYPYYPEVNKALGSIGDSNGKITGSYALSCYDDSPIMAGKWENFPYYESYVDEYSRKIRESYRRYPSQDRIPRLLKVCRETDFDKTDINEITTFILYTLQNNARYSKTPGSVPFNTETVEYFLFDNHQGYCVHFATSAALMYRIFGIPARYVTGYSLNPSDFQKMDHGSEAVEPYDYDYTATVSDKSAHAWVEIFLKDYGWVPVEVTPTLDGHMSAVYPGYNNDEMNRIMNKYGWKFKKRNADGTAAEGTENGDGGDDIDAAQIILFGFIGSLLLFAAGMFVRRLYIINMQRKMNCRRAFDRLISVLHFGGVLNDKYGSETDFAQKLFQVLPELGEENIIRMISVLQTENYSAGTVSEEDHAFVREMYKKTVDIMMTKIPWYKKPLVWIIKCYV